MKWQAIRKQYPHRWVLVEAIKAHSQGDKRIVDDLCVIHAFSNVDPALSEYKQMHRKEPKREYYVVHTDKSLLEIFERQWLGIRSLQ